MTRTRQKIHAFGCGVLFTLAGCASTPPPIGLLDEAQNAIREAREARADDFSPVELGFAEEALAAAKLGMEQRDYDVARRNAMRAELNATLAAARSRAAAGREAVRRHTAENARLRRELLGEGAGS